MSILSRVASSSSTVFENAGAFLPLAQHEPGIVLLPPEALGPADLVAVLHACAREGGRWAPVLVEVERENVMALPLLPAYRYLIEDVLGADGSSSDDIVLRLPDVAGRLRKVRHDINNPLAAALAETQLLLMDVSDAEAHTALTSIQEQLRRIRDLLVRLSLPAPPRHDDLDA